MSHYQTAHTVECLLSCGQTVGAAVGLLFFQTLVCVWISSITTDEAQPKTTAKISISFKNDKSML